MLVRFYDIEWELEDEEGRPMTAEDAGVPTEVILEVDDGMNVELGGADFLSDKFGWLVESFHFQAEGKCPLCQADLDYEGGEVQDGTYVYEVACPACDWAGKECYDLCFSSQET